MMSRETASEQLSMAFPVFFPSDRPTIKHQGLVKRYRHLPKHLTVDGKKLAPPWMVETLDIVR